MSKRAKRHDKPYPVTYECLLCGKEVTEIVNGPRRPLKKGICAPCAIKALRKALGEPDPALAEFAPAVEFVLANEGGYNPNDAGCPSNFGIRQASYPHLDIKNLTRDDAILIYQRDYWKFGELASQRLATKMLDVYVNEEHDGVKLLQQSLAYLQAGPIVVDGIFGPQTIEHANAADADALIDELKARLALHYAQGADPALQLGLIRRAVKG